VLLKNAIRKFGISLALLALCLILSFASPYFLSVINLMNVLLQVAIITIIAVGMTFVILTSGIDLGVGSVVALAAVIIGTILKLDLNACFGGNVVLAVYFKILAAVILGIITGGVCGWINGAIVAYGKVPSFIVTLGMMSIARGTASMITGGQTIHLLPQEYRWFGNGYVGIIPVPVIIAIMVVGIAYYVLTQTRFGRYVFGIGGNRESVRLSGIKVSRFEIWVYVISGLTCGLGAVINVGRLNAAQPIAGAGYELDAIAAVVIGGTSLTGGEGSVFGTLIGAVFMGVLRNGLNLLNVSAFLQQIITGCVIIAAAFYDQSRKHSFGLRIPIQSLVKLGNGNNTQGNKSLNG
jgi:ribose transport system permease protein